MLTTAAKNYILEHGLDANFILIGKGTTPAAVTDTKLGNETYRLYTTSGRYSNILTFFCVLSKQMPTDTYTEIGIVRAGKLRKDTGNLIARIVSSITKNINTMYLLKFKFTFTGFTNIQ